MDKSLRLSMPATLDEAKASVSAYLVEQGFDVRVRGDGLEADRPLPPRGKAAKRPVTRFRVGFSSMPEGTAVDVEPITGAPAVRSIVVTMRARLSQTGQVEDGGASDAEALANDDGTTTFWPFDQLPASPPDPPSNAATSRPPLNALAVTSLVLGVLAPVGGIVTGAIGLGQIRRTGERGRGLALGGVVLGSVLTTVVSVTIVAAAGALIVSSTSDGAGDGPAATASASPTVPIEDAASSTFAPNAGQCFVQRGAGEIGEANLVDCGVPHAYEIYAQFALSGEDYPGDELVSRDAVGGCRDRFAAFVGTNYDESRLELVYLSPTLKEWARGDRAVSCLLTDPDAAVTGSLRGSQR